MNAKTKILFLAATPDDRAWIRTDKELRDVDEALRRAGLRDKFELVSRHAVRPADLRRAVLEENPDILHFAGHGEATGLILESEQGDSQPAPTAALADLFRLFADKLRCVVLNACYSADQAEAIAAHIAYVAGMKSEVSDRAAHDFAVGFYDALGNGRDIAFAFDYARNAVHLAGHESEYLKPVLLRKPDALSRSEASPRQQRNTVSSTSRSEHEPVGIPMSPSRFTIRWLHLSDFHTGKDDYAQLKLFERILEHVRGVLKTGWIPDFVFLTGDIANKGLATEYKTFNDEFLERLLLEELDAWEGKVYIVPGNHDVMRSRVEALDRNFFTKPGGQVFDATEAGSQKRWPLLQGIQTYSENDESHAPKDWLKAPAGTYSERVTVRDCEVGIVGLNTAWLSKDDSDRHQLTPGVPLLEDALQRVQGCPVRIVLGHHPLDWWRDAELERVGNLLSGTLYLHGHLHRARANVTTASSGRAFLCVQAGAAFQARDDEPWRNGLLWGELDEHELRLQPQYWSADKQAWILGADDFHPNHKNGDWWAFPLPQPASEKPSASPPPKPKYPDPPEGWRWVDQTFIQKRRADLAKNPLSEEDAVRFFDGALPEWRTVLAPQIPRREITAKLLKHFTDYTGQGRPQVVLLQGAGGEGKSTAFLQTVAALAEADWLVLWHWDDNPRFDLKLTDLPVTEHPWLVASDDAGLIAKPLFDTVKALQKQGRADVRFLLAARDTDWFAAEARVWSWSSYAVFREEKLGGLTDSDATAIVHAWGAYGAAGLKQLAKEDPARAVQRLTEAAHSEGHSSDGAFLGAMLKVRIGDELKDHVKLLLSRLQGRPIMEGNNSLTLLDAFGYIAAMHAEGLAFLSKPVLAQVLNCETRLLRPKVLAPLGREAAMTKAGEFIFTRHRSIAQAAMEILEEVFGYDGDEWYVELGKSASAVRVRGEDVPELHKWRYDLPKKFINSLRTNLAIRFIHAMLEKDPTNTKMITNFASILCEVNKAEDAVRILRNSAGKLKDDRPFYAELGIAEGEAGRYALNVWLAAFSLADNFGEPPDNKTAKLVLNRLGIAVQKLYEQYHDRRFIEARSAVAQLGLQLQLEAIDYKYFNKYLADSRAAGVTDAENLPDEAMQRMETALTAAWGEYCGERDEFAGRLPAPAEMTFNGLRKLIVQAMARR